jgi:4-amino-4-deoxy-L-arabinose transferase-like glycosyltransferase
MAHAQLVRTDAAGMFFGMLALWACVRLRDAPTARRHVATGVAIGLAVASRYFYGVLLLPYAAACLLRDGERQGAPSSRACCSAARRPPRRSCW